MTTEIKKMGRPRSFDEDAALLAAINVFWEKGYDGASMKNLTQAMDINAPSLYAVFGDKKGLYIKAIERYISDDSCTPVVALDSEDNIEKAVKAFMKAAIEYATQQPEGRLGCFMANCVSGSTGSVEGTQELLKEAIFAADSKLMERFEAEKQNGNLPQNFPSKERAKLMFDLRQGYVLRARAGISQQEMEKELNYRVHMILHIPTTDKRK